MKRLNKLFAAFFAAAFVASLLLGTGCSTSKVENKSNGNQLVLDSAVKQGKLDNGVTYFIRENGEPKNRIQLRLVVKAGSCMEDEDQKGIAHFVEHMCYNGTENFQKSEIVDYFEKIGMKFGPEVNADTSFEQTVYILEIPADNPEILKTSLLVLHDWACSVTFDPVEFEKERGVIIEEWRQRTQGVNWRVAMKEVGLVLKDSRYEKRLPIGDINVIKNIKLDRVVDFYKKWYLPENMAVVAVGDIKADVLEKAIKEVMGTIPASEKETKVPSFKVPLQTEKSITILRDKELSVTEICIFQQLEESKPVTTIEQIREGFISNIVMSIFNQRCHEKTSLPDAEWLTASSGMIDFTRKNYNLMLDMVPKAGRFKEALKAFIDEYERFLKYGVTKTELERVKKSMLQGLQQSYENKDKHSSINYVNSLVNYYTLGNIFTTEEDSLKISTKIINEITAEEILELTKKILADRGTMMLIIAPESADIPSEKEIVDIWKNYESEAEAYKDDVVSETFMKKPSNKGKIIEKKALKELGGTQYTFENGVKIITKKTDFKKDSIAIYGGSKGGIYQLKEEEIPSAQISIDYSNLSGRGGITYSQFQKISTTKNLAVSIGMNNTREFFNATANKNNLEESLQLINLMFTKPQFGEDAWKTIYTQYSEIADSYGAKPMQVFSDKINELVMGKNIYSAPFNKDYVKKMDPKIAEKVYRERFANPADFTFIFVGDFDEKELVDLCAYYFGSLKTNDKFDETKYVYFPFPKESKSIVVNKGIDDKGHIYMAFGDSLPVCDDLDVKFRENEIIHQLASLLNIRLREVIREDKSGSYGVSTNGYIDGWPERYYRVSIEFGCEPARQDELYETVIDTIKEIQKGNISDDLIEKLKETYIRTIETNMRNNYWWLNRFTAEVLFEYEPTWFTKDTGKVAEWITKEALVEAANKYLNTDVVLKAYLKPER